MPSDRYVNPILSSGLSTLLILNMLTIQNSTKVVGLSSFYLGALLRFFCHSLYTCHVHGPCHVYTACDLYLLGANF